MGLFVQLIELVTVFVPDFLSLGLATLAFFNLFCVAKTLDVARNIDTNSALGVSLALGYLVTIAINVLSSMQALPRSRRTTLVQWNSRVEQGRPDSLSGKLREQPVKHGGGPIES